MVEGGRMNAEVKLERGRNGDRAFAVLCVDGISLRLSGHQYSAMKQSRPGYEGPEAPEFLLEIAEVINRDGAAWQRVTDVQKCFEEERQKVCDLMNLLRQYDTELCLAGSDGMSSADMLEKAEEIQRGKSR